MEQAKIRSRMLRVLDRYDLDDVHVGCIGSHSALEIAYGASREGLSTVVVCQKGREKTYTQHYKNLFDRIIMVDSFEEICRREVLAELQELNTIFVPNRSFSVYVGYDNIEKRFQVPLMGNRDLLRAEERSEPRNQYWLLEKAGLRIPRHFSSPEEIDRVVMVKLPHAVRKVERGFFTVSSPKEYAEKSKELVSKGAITQKDLDEARIEEYVVGVYFNLDFFCSPLNHEIDFLGADQRIETNIEGIIHMTSHDQLQANLVPSYMPIGHRGLTLRESQLDKVFELAYKFASTASKYYPPGIIGCFALQGLFDKDLGFTTFDVSLRVPGAPILLTTNPYMLYKYGKQMSAGERYAMEIKEARKQSRMKEIVT